MNHSLIQVFYYLQPDIVVKYQLHLNDGLGQSTHISTSTIRQVVT